MSEEQTVNTGEVLEPTSPVDTTPAEVDPDIAALTKAFNLKGKEAEPPQEEPKPEGEEPPAEVAHEEAVHEEKKEPELDQATKTWLGRKISEHAREATKPLLDKIAALENELLASRQPQQPTQPEIGFDPDETVYTKGEVAELLNILKEKDPDFQMVRQSREKQAYVEGYKTSLAELFQADSATIAPDVRQEVAKELDEVLRNPISHKDPSVAAERNYRAALTAVLTRKITGPTAGPTVPGNGNKPPVSATGLPTGTTKKETKPIMQVSAEAKRLQAAFGLSDEKVQEILARR